MKYVSAHRKDYRGKPDPQGETWGYGSIASFNRWDHKPHQHRREIARRLRQQADAS